MQRGGIPVSPTTGIEEGDKLQAFEYTVQVGDTLWAIAERFYGSGSEYARLVDANLGRLMSDGGRFTQAGVIRPGWILLVPQPSRAVEEVDGDLWYVVEEGDTLQGIAARLLGNETRWHEIFGLNNGTARLVDGRVLRNPDLIWPGLRLRLPLGTTEHTVDSPAPTQDHTSRSSEPVPTVAAAPAAGPTPQPDLKPTVQRDSESTNGTGAALLYGGAGLAAGAVAAGAGVMMLRRRARRSLSEPPIPPPARPDPSDDFAEAEFARQFTNRVHGGGTELVVQVAQHALRFMVEHGLENTPVVMARQGRNATTLILDAGLQAQAQLLELGGEFAARLGGKGLASLTPDRDIALQVNGTKLAGLHTPLGDRATRPLCLLPMGVLPNHETLYVNWDELRHILVAWGWNRSASYQHHCGASRPSPPGGSGPLDHRQ